MAGNKCLWCNLPSHDKYCKPHLALGLALDRLDEQIEHWDGDDFESLDLLIAARDGLYRKLAEIEPEVGDDEQPLQ